MVRRENDRGWPLGLPWRSGYYCAALPIGLAANEDRNPLPQNVRTSRKAVHVFSDKATATGQRGNQWAVSSGSCDSKDATTFSNLIRSSLSPLLQTIIGWKDVPAEELVQRAEADDYK